MKFPTNSGNANNIWKDSTERRVQQSGDNSKGDGYSKEEAELNRGKRRNLVEIAILCVLIAIIWSLLLIPIIFYYLPLPRVSVVWCSSLHTDSV